MKNVTLFLFLVLVVLQTFAQPRHQQTINTNWKFCKKNIENVHTTNFNHTNWKTVSIPHTWNAQDILDDTPGYYRGIGWYRKKISIPASMQNKQIYLFFEGANQDAEIYVNGKPVGVHYGGYTAFCFDITEFINFATENLLAIKLSNRYNKDVPPVGGDLCHFGGIYRNVYWIACNHLHFDLNFFASSGVFLTTPIINKNKAVVRIKSHVKSKKSKQYQLKHTIFSPDGKPLTTIEKPFAAQKDKTVTIALETKIENPALWSPETPNLYQVVSELYDENGRLSDQTTNPLGFRTLDTDSERGILLNGEPVFIKGIGKHQDYDKQGYAVASETNRNDMYLLKATGANLVRSHYPLAPECYDICDQNGIMVWGKIPIMDKITHTEQFIMNAQQAMQELIYQNFNRPSFIMWGYACEIFGDMDWYWPKPKDKEKVNKNIQKTKAFSFDFEEFVHQIDPSRLTANDFHTDPTPEFYKQAELTELNDINGWNIYQGWYHNNIDSIGWALKTFRDYNTDVPFLIAEFGAGSDTRIHTYQPTIFDFSIEYQNMFHEEYLKQTRNFDFVHGMCVWTLVDFQVENRADALPHINSKGLLCSNRTPKDAYYLYQAHWTEKPMVHIAAHHWTRRMEIVAGKTAVRPITVYSNQQQVELFQNGKSLGVKQTRNHKAVWNVAFGKGTNQLEATILTNGKKQIDFVEITFDFIPENTKANGIPDKGICINVGQSRTYFINNYTKNVWIPCKKYEDAGFGYQNGNYYRLWNNMPAWNGIREGTDHDIYGTSLDPVFQTFLIGTTDYQIDVPDGEYEISILFAEPFNQSARRNPNAKTGANDAGERIFNVYINDLISIDSLNLSKQYGDYWAVIKTFRVRTSNRQGIHLKLEPVKGKPIINGIKIMKH